MLREFKEFIARGNVIDLAVAVVIGAAFGKIVTSLVEGVIMPPIGLALGHPVVVFRYHLPAHIPDHPTFKAVDDVEYDFLLPSGLVLAGEG